MNSKITGKLISSKRKELGLTQKELAEKISVTNRAVSKWETGEGFPDISVLPELSRVLEISIDELLTGEKPTVVNNDTNNEENIILQKKQRGKLLVAEIVSFALAFASNAIGLTTELKLFHVKPFYVFIEAYLLVLSILLFVVSVTVFFTSLVKYRMETEAISSSILTESLIFTLFSILLPVFTVFRILHWYNLLASYIFLALAFIIIEILTILTIRKIKIIRKNEKKNN